MRIVYHFFLFFLSLSSDIFYLLCNFKKAEKLGRFKMSPEFFFVKCIKNNVALFIVLLYLEEIRTLTCKH
jgi:hypothetical protein